MTLNRRETEAARLLDLVYDAIFAIEEKSHAITYWNAGAERMYGFSRSEALGKVSHALLKTRFPAEGEIAYQEVIRTGSWEGPLIQTRKNGTQVYVDARWAADVEAGIILEVNRDVTRHHDVSERFELLVRTVAEYAIFMLDRDGNVVTWNAGARRIKGYEEAEVVGRNFEIFYTPEARAQGVPKRHLADAAAAGNIDYEGWRVRKDGTRFWASVVLTALRDPFGELTGFAKVTRDMTGKQMERQRLEELERSKSTFLNLVAHELRSPLTVIRGYLSLFRDVDDARRIELERRSLPALQAKTEEMGRLVDQMVEVARLEEGSMRLREERFDLAATVEHAVSGAQALDEEAHRVNLEAFDEELNVVGDEERTRIVLSNLLSNAIKYSPGGGEVVVTVRSHGNYGCVLVRDRGVGIADADRPKLFAPFTRIERKDLAYVPGTGMGLYLSRELARRQGGDVQLLPSTGEGSTFELCVPLAERPADSG
jgi:PAS domain S-box-containing protein